jgi:Trypsin-like peptidase domain
MKPTKSFRVVLPDGSTIETQWAYAPQGLRNTRESLQQRIVCIWAVDQLRGMAHRLGTGAVVVGLRDDSLGRNHAIVVTNEHVIADALEKFDVEAYKRLPNLFSKSLPQLLRPHIQAGSLRVAYHAKTDSLIPALRINAVSVMRSVDLGVLLVELPSTRDDTPILTIDSDPLPVGTQILVAGFPPSPIDGSIEMAHGQWTASSGNLNMLSGYITAVTDNLGLRPAFGYEISCPLPAGMSGSPMFAADSKRRSHWDIAGICMAESEINPEYDIRKPGRTYVLGAQNIYAVPIAVGEQLDFWTAQNQGDNQKPIRGSVFQDSGRRTAELSVHVDPSGRASVSRNAT